MVTAVPRTPTSIIQKRSINPFAHTFHAESQDSEPYVDTPHVTPNGSLHWGIRDTSSIPASSSQEPVPEAVTYSQLGLSPEFSQGDTSPITPIVPPSHTVNSDPSFLSSREAPDSSTDSPTPASPDLHPVSSKRTRARRNADMISPDPPSPRYFLRRRSLLSVHTPPRLRSHPYPVKVSPPRKNAKASSRPRRIRNDSRNGFQESLPSG
ncbi:hypothetical protein SERLADRAFT_461496 [Serpula lacrymans var. lacrymans S7.9]|nr:uncharacterized protein SERLADRAFT_461496 [Serpula lacrymans var. lacrymans S7.9]EGO27657.1 hypothetical protein SERLADRAFT_461496 [Serpula lacrymans var. lacrymans S7.9]